MQEKKQEDIVIQVGQIWKRNKRILARVDTIWLYILVLEIIEKGLPSARWKAVKIISWNPATKEEVGGITHAGMAKFPKNYSFIGALPLTKETLKKLCNEK